MLHRQQKTTSSVKLQRCSCRRPTLIYLVLTELSLNPKTISEHSNLQGPKKPFKVVTTLLLFISTAFVLMYKPPRKPKRWQKKEKLIAPKSNPFKSMSYRLNLIPTAMFLSLKHNL